MSGNDGIENHAIQTRKVVVIGYGSPIRGDDAIGPLVADRLMSELDHAGVEVFSRHVLTAELCAALEDASLVLFLDASVEGELGKIRERVLRPSAKNIDFMAHSLGPRELLAWTSGLYGNIPQAVLLTTVGGCFDYSNYHLTPEVRAAIEPMIERVKWLVAEHLDGQYAVH